MIIFNPGSEFVGGSFDVAKLRAEWVLKNQILGEGIVDVEIMSDVEKTKSGWVFKFRHRVTGVVVYYSTHGLCTVEGTQKWKDDNNAWAAPRDYWDGSSCSDPQLEDWLKDGFKVVKKIERL